MSVFTIVPFQPSLAHHFRMINEEWITEMFALESKDLKVLQDPQKEVIEQRFGEGGGGHILFVEDARMGIVGTGALLQTGVGEYELTKMGVLKRARGLKAGDFLLKSLIHKAHEIGATNLYLLTNGNCKAAIHLYEKNGFVHDAEIMKRFGSEYLRGDVAMRYRG